MAVAKILLPINNLIALDYLVPDDLIVNIGDLVIVPFRNDEVTGIVWDTNVINTKSKLKTIKQKVPLEYKIDDKVIGFIKWTSNYYLNSLGSILKLVLPVDIGQAPIKVKIQHTEEHYLLPDLSLKQQIVLEEIRSSNKPSIIKGVTGSGKTEIYFHLILDYLKQGKQALIMLPEISISSQIIKRFTARFGFEPVVWNSSITKAQKKMALRGILSNQVKIVIGTRSSLFLPYSNLGIIIVDEEHDASYKQEEGTLYNARDMAVLRSSLSNIKLVLCSATPSIETIYNVRQNKYQLVSLGSRFKEASLPEIALLDMRQEKLPPNSWLSTKLIDSIKNNLGKKEQILLFLNRRGYAPMMLCKACGYRFSCCNCSAWLVLHKATKTMDCHHCGCKNSIYTFCPECLKDDSLTLCGPGIERIEEEVNRLFPSSRITSISRDSNCKPSELKELLSKMENNEIDILIGTQVITKGYHFPNLTLVGVIDADLGVSSVGDLRSSERTYQLLHQVGGRAGREQKKGMVLMQTYYPDNIIFHTLKNSTEDEFIDYELSSRQLYNMPPFAKMASITVTSKNEHKTLELTKHLVAIAPTSSARILGPAKAVMSKLAGKYRYRILVLTDRKFNIQKYLTQWLGLVKIPSIYQIKIDIDPQNFY
jgi:primosomal protein N' (replication factor Y)